MTAPPADPPESPSAHLHVVGLVTDRAQVDEALLAAFYAQRNFNLTSTALQRRMDRLKIYIEGRSKVLGAEVKRTAKEYDVHRLGEAWTSYQLAADEVRRTIKAGEDLPLAALNEVLAFAPAGLRLYDAHKAAVKKKKDELDGLRGKLSSVEAALAKLLRHGIGARQGDAEAPQPTLPGLDTEPSAVQPWLDEGSRQAVFDTLSKEMRLIEIDIVKAANSNDQGAKARAEQDKRQHAELLEQLGASGLLDGLVPDDEDETVAPDPADVADEPDVEFHDEQAEGELEDPTKHPALAPAIAKTAAKRAAKKTTRAKTGKGRSRRSR